MLLDLGAWKPDSGSQDLVTLQKWLNALVDGINDCLCDIDAGNLNEQFLGTLKATSVVAQTIISNTTITQNLYATYGDIAELTCDRLLTADKVDRYKASNTDAINYIWIQDQSIKLITGTTDGTTTQHTDRDGNLLYWNDATMQSMGTGVTSYPVTVYDYTELVKSAYNFEYDETTEQYVPKIQLGAGTGTGNNGKAFIYKGVSGFYIDYYSAASGELRRILLNDGGVVITPYELQSLSFYSNGFSATYSGETVSYIWQKDSYGRITALITDDDVTIPVTWNSGAM